MCLNIGHDFAHFYRDFFYYTTLCIGLYCLIILMFWLAQYVTYHVQPHQPIIDQQLQGLGLRGLVHKEAHPVIPDLH